MSLRNVSKKPGIGSAELAGIGELVYQLAGLRQDVVAGAAAGTKMNIAAISPEDVIIGASVFTDASAAAVVSDKANITIQPLAASGTVTVAGVNDLDTVTIDGIVFTFKNTPTSVQHVKRTAGNDNANALALKNAINAYKHTYARGNNRGALNFDASVSTNVVTFTATKKGTSGNSITLVSSNGTRLAVSGAGTLAGGTATGGIKSTTNLTGKTLVVTWFDIDR